MKICILGLRGIPGVMGGIETHCRELFPRVRKAQPDLEIVVLARKPYVAPRRYRYRGISVVPLWTIRNKYAETVLHTALGILYARFAIKPDILHLHSIGAGLLSPLARLLGLRVVVTHHGEDFQRKKWNAFAKFVLRLGEHASVRSAEHVIVVGRSLAARLKNRFPARAERIHFIPNGAPDSACDPNTEREALGELGLESRAYVLSVGRLVPEKGFHELISAFEGTQSKRKLVIAGGADHKDKYYEFLQAQRCANVVLVGFQTSQRLHALYRNASLFVLASSHEGLPIAALEALKANAPVLLSDIEAHRDLALPACNYFPVHDVDALRKKLWLEHSSFSVDADSILEAFDWDSVAAQTAFVYQDARGQPRPEVPVSQEGSLGAGVHLGGKSQPSA